MTFGFGRPKNRNVRGDCLFSLERVNRELRRRFRVVGSFVFEASCLRLASAVLMEMSDEWEMGKVYLTLTKTQ